MGQSEACMAIAQALGERDIGGVLEALRGYRKHRNRQNFEGLVRQCLEKPGSLSK